KDDSMPVPSKSQLARIAAVRAGAIEKMTARLGDMTPGPGQFAVTIRIDRPDGQFVTSVTTVPADLMTRPDPDLAQEMAAGKITGGFIAAYRRAAELPE